jgi:hypothetical protein
MLAAEATTVMTADALLGMCEWLFDQQNLFYRLHMRDHLINLIARSLQSDGQMSTLHTAVATLRTRRDDSRISEVLAGLDDVGIALAQPGPVRTQSFVQRVVLLKDNLKSPEQRAVVERYLKIGF